MQSSQLKEKSFELSIEIIQFVRYYNDNGNCQSIFNQFLRSGTSIGANISEAMHAESRADFIHKLKISQKECAETLYWVNLLNRTKIISPELFNTFEELCSQILRMLISSIITAKANQHKSRVIGKQR